MKKKVGILGKGKWGTILKKNIKKNFELIFFKGKNFNIKDTEQVDWVILAVPTDKSFYILKKLIKKKKNIFAEKPLTDSFDKTKKIYLLYKKQNANIYCSDIENFKKKKITIKKKNWIVRKKYSNEKGNIVFRLVYHDIYLLYFHFKDDPLVKIKIFKYDKSSLNFRIITKKTYEFNFLYSLSSSRNIHSINNVNFISKTNYIEKMFNLVLNNKVDFNQNKKMTMLTSKIVEKILNKIKLFKKC